MKVRRQRSPAIAIALVFFTRPGNAQSLDSMTLANELGTLLASEEICGLTFKQDAIQAFIEKKVRANDLSFPPTLNVMTTGAEAQIKDMSTSARTAHCAQIRRLAVSYGFVGK